MIKKAIGVVVVFLVNTWHKFFVQSLKSKPWRLNSYIVIAILHSLMACTVTWYFTLLVLFVWFLGAPVALNMMYDLESGAKK